MPIPHPPSSILYPQSAIKRIVLAGNPNVGKSVLFHRLTGVRVFVSNYPGTTVGYTRGRLHSPGPTPPGGGLPFALGDAVEVIDAPGIYSLEPTSKAEEVASEIIATAEVIVNVVDATNLERNLDLTLQLLEKNIPAVVALNLWDETSHLGIAIDPGKLESLLGVPVVPTAAVTGEGVRNLVAKLSAARRAPRPPSTPPERWKEIGDIVAACQVLTPRRHTFLQRLSDVSVQPLSGSLLAAVVMFAAFKIVRFVGEGIIARVADPFFERIYAPILYRLSALLGGDGLFHNILIGKLIEGRIDFKQSLGLLTTAPYIEFAMVLPYVASFYFVLSFLEDFGYLPRLAVLLDSLMHRVGLHGYAIIPNLLGLGCNVPAILATRILESRKERFIAATMISIAVPCAALQAMIFGLVGARGGIYVGAVYLVLFLVWLLLGVILKIAVKGYEPELIIEIPHYRLPPLGPFLAKVWMRISGFLREAVPVISVGILAVNLLYYLKVFDAIADLAAPVVTRLWGLPRESVVVILVGFLRKDVAVGMLGPLNLSPKQLVVATTVLAMFFPCIATFAVFLKEFGVKDMLKSSAIMLATATGVGAALNLLL